jgi:hypothetical protein
MPLPRELQPLVGTARFWSDYFGDGVFEESVAGLPEDPFLELPLSRRHSLRLGYAFPTGNAWHIAATSLTLRQTDTGRDMHLGWHDAHQFPHVLRSEEADLIGRLWARRDRDLPHPGVPFLLLVPYIAPIAGSDHLLGLRLLNRALQSLGVFTERQIRYRLSAFNRVPAKSEWRRVRPYGWVCHAEPVDLLNVGDMQIYSLRVAPAGDPLGLPPDVQVQPEMHRLLAEMAATAPRFPFDEWNDCMRRTRRGVAQRGEPSLESAAADPLPPLSRHVELCYQVTDTDAAQATIPALRDALFRRGLGVCHVLGSWSAFENQDDPHADLDHPQSDAEYRLYCYGGLAEIVAVVRRVVDEAGRPEVRLYQRRHDAAGPPYRRIELQPEGGG